ncbi:MAG: hypothetical protein ABIK09_10045 [Pseudomonadota bacterium]
MFQVATGLFAGYAIDADDKYSWAHSHIPVELAVGAFDFLEIGAGLQASMSEPSKSGLNTHLYLRGTPVPELAITAGMFLPDSQNSDEVGAIFGLEGNFPVIPGKLAVRGGLGVDHFSKRYEGTTELKFFLGLRWNFVDQFYLGLHSGIDKIWWSDSAFEDYYGSNLRYPLDLEIGFTSRKQVDLVAHWGWSDWSPLVPFNEDPEGPTEPEKETQRYFALDLRVRF